MKGEERPIAQRVLLITAGIDELLHDALGKMLKHDVGRLPVVKRAEPDCVVGYLGRASILAARLRYHEEEEVRGRGEVLQALAPRLGQR